MNTRRARRALAKLFEGHVGKDVVSRAWQRTRAAWEAWQEVISPATTSSA